MLAPMSTVFARHRAVLRAAIAFPAALAACSSSEGAPAADVSPDGGAPTTDGGGTTGPFARFCTGTSLRALRLMNAAGPGAWELSTATLPQGSSFVVGIGSSAAFIGYAIGANGATKVDPGTSAGLQLGTDFSSTCVTTAQSASKLFTVLEDSTLYADKAKTGAPCALTAGTTFDDYGFSGGVPPSLSSSKLTSACGFSPGYTSDLVFGMLVVK